MSTAGWMPRASSRSSARLVCSSAMRAVEQRRELLVRSTRLRARPQQQGERDEPRLRAVVQVALEPPALGVAGLDEPRARGAQLLEARPQLGVEARDVAAQQPGQERERQQRGRDERGPPRGVARARRGRGDEQEGEQRADVDRRELQALEPAVRAASAATARTSTITNSTT